MANLKARLYGTQADDDPDGSIAIHAFFAAYVLVATGKRTAAQVRADFNITVGEYNAAAAAVAANGVDVVNAALIYRRHDIYNDAEADAVLGL